MNAPALPHPPDFSRLGLLTEGDCSSWAVFDEERRYRYMLARMWDNYFQDGPPLLQEPVRALMVFGMLNPSKAGAFDNDPTVRKCIGFARRRQCGGILVVNAGAYIATKPRELLMVDDPIGPHNHEMIRIAFGNPLLAIGVAAWGHIEPRIRRRLAASLSEMKCARKLWCYGTTKAGEPRHPLMLAYDTPLVSLADGRPFP